MRRYFWRRLSSRWFDRYLIFSGAVLNALAVVSLVGTLASTSKNQDDKIQQRARLELENAERCDRLMANTEFAPGRDIQVRLANSASYKINYKHQGTYGRSTEGYPIHMVELPTGLLFFEVDDKNMIRRCIPAERLECVAAAGSFEKNGDCVLAVNLPSDCQVMNGKLDGNLCRVPPQARMLKSTKTR